MILHGSLTSPYVRKCRIMALENGMDLPLEIHSAIDAKNPPPSPLRRIPSLQLGDGRLLVDSRVICDYLAGMKPRSLDDRNLEATADGIMDRSVSRFLMLREDQHYHNRGQLDRWETAIAQTLDSLPCPAEQFGIGEITLFCALAYLDLRHDDLNWREQRGALASWFNEQRKRPSVVATEANL